ncbi:LarC family nickel insertion protein [Aestuariimicrobium soli]|uniref:LarC family nickel insertion protein n=1 Tax=Aestuariimicrobium soli TaxID=2035834 RepID=UPI003EBE7F3D
MSHAWIDATAGVAGDMLLGACLDAGARLEVVQQAVDAVIPGSVLLRTGEVVRGGQRGLKLHVDVLADDPPHRRWSTIRASLAEASLDERVRTWATAAFERLAEAEARVHGSDVEDVHFHEVGALDSIADVVGVCAALVDLGVTRVDASPIAVGSGRIRAAHGDIPVPVPAVAELMVGWQVSPIPGGAGPAHHHPHDHPHPHAHPHSHAHGHHDHTHDQPASVTTPGQVGELATPTGVALVRALAEACVPLPAMSVSSVGIGAGGKDFPDHPNVVRLVIGSPADDTPASPDLDTDRVVELQANIDDLDPRLWPGVLATLLARGARDAWLVPILMKKGRPAHTLHALVHADARDGVVDAILTHTSTLGVREHSLVRTMLAREHRTVEVLGHDCRLKVAVRGGRVVHATPEFDDLARIAHATDRAEYEVHTLATAACAALVTPEEDHR